MHSKKNINLLIGWVRGKRLQDVFEINIQLSKFPLPHPVGFPVAGSEKISPLSAYLLKQSGLGETGMQMD